MTELARLEQIVLADPAAARYYVEYVHLHGTLLWDTAKGTTADPSLVASLTSSGECPLIVAKGASQPRIRRRVAAVASIVAALLLMTGLAGWRWFAASPSDSPIADGSHPSLPDVARDQIPPAGQGSGESTLATVGKRSASGATDGLVNRQSDGGATDRQGETNVGPKPDALFPGKSGAGVTVAGGTLAAVPKDLTASAPSKAGSGAPGDGVSREGGTPSVAAVSRDRNTGEIVDFVNAELRSGWESEQVKPSPRAEDSEWLRRVHLDLVGRIPAPAVVERFLKETRPGKQSRLIDSLLDDPQYVRHWTTLWTNLLIGRATTNDAQRRGLQKFLREGFARNRAWKDVVFDLVSAEGTPEENGAAGFLLAHLNNEAVPATAITARVFLGTQVQCTQCHDHPSNDAKQNEFWEFNSFFQQTALVEKNVADPVSGKSVRRAALVNREVGGPNFYETRRGLMRAAFPKFEGEQIDPSPQVNRRRELAQLMVDDDGRQLARSFVNRTWEHFFGAAFTRPVDDMGPHNPPSHPALLERLTTEFVQSGYDVKQLIRWICRSDAYQLSSRFDVANAIDDPAVGNTPLFSRVYVKSMTAEQLYDSLLVATKADEAPRALRVDLDEQRDKWIQQFILDYATEENDEASTFDGTIPQALLVMNGDLVSAAVSSSPGTLLHEVVQDRGSENDKIRRLCLAALSRYPTSKETSALRKALHERVARAPRSQNRDVLLAEGYQDVFWAFLNSNEFVLVH